MKIRVASCLCALAFLGAPAVRAQDAPSIVFGTYYRCDQGRADLADALYKQLVAPILKTEVAAGRVAAFGWAKHWEGGEWRRLEYMSGPDIDKLVDAREAVIAKTTSPEAAKALQEFYAICPSHDDYVWASVTGSQPGGAVLAARPPVAFSTYFVCDSREDEADAIVKNAFAAVLNQHVKDHKIASWSWLQHRLGGQYRRLLVLDGADHKGMLKIWGSLAPALDAAQPELARRFREICSSHTDYMWDIVPN